MDRSDLDVALAWAAAEGWNPGLHDAAAFWAADPGGFLIARLDGAPVATISAVRSGDDFAFLGLYIVAPEQRGHGYGRAIFDAALDHVEGRSIALDGVVAEEHNYARDGFVSVWRNARRELVDPSRVTPSGATTSLGAVGLDALVDYDSVFFAAPREAFLAAWVGQPGAVGRAVVDDGGALRGWGLRRRCGEGHKIGPLGADDAEVADALFRDLVAGADGPVFLDTPNANLAAVALAERYDLAVTFETVRMVRGETRPLDLERLYGITTFELG